MEEKTFNQWFTEFQNRIVNAGFAGITDFCRKTDINRATLYNFKQKNKLPKKKMMNRIESAIASVVDVISFP